MVQIDSLRLDVEETARCTAAFYRDFDRRVAGEAVHLRQLGARLVIGDAPPLAFAAAQAAGIPSVLVANFTWDWIYAYYPEFESLAPGIVETIASAYSSAAKALRLPICGGFESVAGGDRRRAVHRATFDPRSRRHAPGARGRAQPAPRAVIFWPIRCGPALRSHRGIRADGARSSRHPAARSQIRRPGRRRRPRRQQAGLRHRVGVRRKRNAFSVRVARTLRRVRGHAG